MAVSSFVLVAVGTRPLKESIRKALERKRVVNPPTVTAAEDELEQYYTPKDVAELLRVSVQTVKAQMQDEAEGVIRIGNGTSTSSLRRYVTERYSKSAVLRLRYRLEKRNN